jgi:hypothetical protein
LSSIPITYPPEAPPMLPARAKLLIAALPAEPTGER